MNWCISVVLNMTRQTIRSVLLLNLTISSKLIPVRETPSTSLWTWGRFILIAIWWSSCSSGVFGSSLMVKPKLINTSQMLKTLSPFEWINMMAFALRRACSHAEGAFMLGAFLQYYPSGMCINITRNLLPPAMWCLLKV